MLGHPMDVLLADLATRAAAFSPGLAQPVQQLLQGERRGAETGFRTAAATGATDAGLALALAATTRRLALLALPDGGARQGIHAMAEFTAGEAQDTSAIAAVPPSSPSLQPLVSLVGTELFRVAQWQSMLPPNTLPNAQFTPQVLSQAEASAGTAYQLALQLGPRPAVLVQAWLADILRRGGATERAQQLLAGARAAAPDPVTAAVLDVLRGDWLAAPLSSPVAWNCSLQPVFGPDGTLGGLEEREGGVDVRAAEAWACYYSAAAALPDDVWRSHLDLRRGWLAQVSGDPAAAVAWATAARDRYTAVGHVEGWAAASVHVALARLAAGSLPADEAGAALVGTTAVSRAGAGLAVGLAQLCARVGRVWRESGVATEPALGALDLTSALARAAGEPGLLARSTVDRAQVLAAIGATRPARLHLERALRVLGEDTAAVADGSAGAGEALLLLQLYQLSIVERDGAGMRAAARRFHGQADRGGLAALPPAVALVGPLVPPPDADGLALAYEAERAGEDGDDAGRDRLLALADSLIAPGEPARVAVLAIRHDLPAAAEAARDLYATDDVPPLLGSMGAAAEALPDDVRASMLSLEHRRLDARALGMFARLRDVAHAEPRLARLREADDPWWPGLTDEADARLCEGLVREGTGDHDGAWTSYLAGLAAVDRRRRTLSADELKTALSGGVVAADLVRAAARVALLDERAADGFEQAVDGRSRGLVDLLAANAGGDRRTTRAVAAWRGTAAAREQASRQLLYAVGAGADGGIVQRLQREEEQAAAAAREAERALAAEDPGYWRTVNPAAVRTRVADVAAALAPAQVLLQLLVEAGDVMVWVVAADGVRAAHLARDQWDLVGACARWRRACAEGGEAATDAATIADAVLAPVADALRGAVRVVVVASGPTVGLPFGALPFDGGYLGGGRVITTLPSAAVLPMLGADRYAQPLDGALVVGDPRAMSTRDTLTGAITPAEPLPGARVEARYVASLLPHARCLVGPQATESAVRATLTQAAVVHFATHGIVDPVSPQGSAVLLADGAGLEVAEIAGLRLRAGLVVLSACHTYGGEPAGGDELLGLARAVLAAGARAVVVSLWDVNDVSAALLMGRFYEGLAAGADPAWSLAAAQSWLAGLTVPDAETAYARLRATVAGTDADPDRMTDRRVAPARPVTPVGYAHPRHWAAFQLVGA